VLDWSARETATLLDMSVVAVNSALQRARATMAANRPHGRVGKPPATPTPEELALVERSIDAHQRADVNAMADMLREDVRIAMPPLPFWFNGKQMFVPGLEAGLKDPGEWRLVSIGANRSPAMATYLRAWDDTVFRAFKIDVMRVEDGLVAEITTFDTSLFPAFGLAPTLGPPSASM
jgi:RNA polymerase sigma-70 factor (ECF subfamily)